MYMCICLNMYMCIYVYMYVCICNYIYLHVNVYSILWIGCHFVFVCIYIISNLLCCLCPCAVMVPVPVPVPVSVLVAVPVFLCQSKLFSNSAREARAESSKQRRKGQQSPTHVRRSRRFHQKSPTFHQKSRTQKRPTFHQKSPIHYKTNATRHMAWQGYGKVQGKHGQGVATYTRHPNRAETFSGGPLQSRWRSVCSLPRSKSR